MALTRFRAAPLPNPPGAYDAQYVRQLIRVLETYFSQLDSKTPNFAESYTADRFIGGTLSASDVTATSVSTSTLTAASGVIEYLAARVVEAAYADTISVNAQIGEITSLMVGDVYGGRFYGDGRYLDVPYNQFQSQVDQTAAAIDQAYAVKLEITDFADGIYIAGANDTEITFSDPGVYSISYSLSFKNTTNEGQFIDIWFRYNDGTGAVDVPNSNSRFFVSARKNNSEPSYVIANLTYTGIATAADAYVEIMWRVSDTAVVMEHLPAVSASAGVTPAIPATPSAIVQANFVSAEYPPVTRVAPLPVFAVGQLGSVSVITG
jgi:hypothetical protein